MKKIIFFFFLLFSCFFFFACESEEKESLKLVFKVNNGYLQWQYEGAEVWNIITSVEEIKGSDGLDGISSYDLAVRNGFSGNLEAWLESLKGDDVFELAVQNGFSGNLEAWLESLKGDDVFELAVQNGFSGNLEAWLKSLNGLDGKSAYEIAVENGFRGDMKTWLNTLKGNDGKSAYELAKENGYKGSIEDWLDSLKSKEENMDRIGTDGLCFELTIKNGIAGYEVISYNGNEEDIVIPNYIFEKPVISIRKDAIPNTVESISISNNTEFIPSFKNYTNLKVFDYNNSNVTIIDDDTFNGCNDLKTIMNYNNIEKIGKRAFYNTKVFYLDFLNIKSLDEKSFASLSFGDDYEELDKLFVFVPKTTIMLGDAFQGDLTVYYEGVIEDEDYLNPGYVFANNNYNNKNIKYQNVKQKDGYIYQVYNDKVSLLNYFGSETRLILPDTIDGNDVVRVGYEGFSYNRNIERIEVSKSITEICDLSFSYNENLHSVFIPKTVDNHFEVAGNNINFDFEIPCIFFEKEVLESEGNVLTFEEYEDYYGKRVMLGVKPSEVVDDDKFVYKKNLTSAEIVLAKKGQISVDIPLTKDGLKIVKINTGAFYSNSLKTVNISSNINKIAPYSFIDCPNLKVINIPKNVEIVNYRAFSDLDNCTVAIESKTIPNDWDSSWYYNINKYETGMLIMENDDYFYAFTNNGVMLVKYLKEIKDNDIINIPSKINGQNVTSIKEECFVMNHNNSDLFEVEFYIPINIDVVEKNGFYYNRAKYYDPYCHLTFKFESENVPSNFNSSWVLLKSYYDSYYSNSSYVNKEFNAE